MNAGRRAAHDPLAGLVARRGHFRFESGHHGDTWLDLDGLFSRPRTLAPSIAALALLVARHDVDVVCGPLLGGAFVAQLLAQALDVDCTFTERVASVGGLYGARYRLSAGLAVRGRRVALVDDVMSAGSSLRATHTAVTDAAAIPVVVATLAVFGRRGSDHFAQVGLPVEALSRRTMDSWAPDDCPLCRAGVPLEDVAAA